MLGVLERFGGETLERAKVRITQALDRLATFPGIGHRRPDLSREPSHRFWLLGPTLIAYRQVGSRLIEVILIERAERNWQRLLERSEDGP